ncbi:helix-turn-helix domain-containing protein [Paenibacillus sp. GCM10023252]|uniref:helix-turn-helix domain-containing protein n=1 Tax=Paenibacillus sp. GCM10023252 TaxID=3252649 RepID=UPI00360AFF24
MYEEGPALPILHKYKSRKYLQRISLSVVFVILIVLIASSIALYVNAEKAVLRVQKEADLERASQIQYNLTFMRENVKELLVKLYSAGDYNGLLFDSGMNYKDSVVALNKLRTSLGSSSYLHSIVVYNGQNKYSFQAGDVNKQTILDLYLGKQDKVPKFRFIPIIEDNYLQYFSMFMYEERKQASSASEESALIINVKPQWLFDNMEWINRQSYNRETNVYLMDTDGTIFGKNNQVMPDTWNLGDTINKRIQGTGKSKDLFFAGSGEEKQVVTYLSTGTEDWTIISVKSYESIMGSIKQLRNTTVLILLIFVVIFVGLGLAVSLRIYKPVERLLSQMKGDIGEESADDDELRMMSKMYKGVVDKYNFNKQNIAKRYHLRRLLLESQSFTPNALTQLVKEHELHIDVMKPLRLLVFQLDNYNELKKNYSHQECKLFQFAIGNIASEILADQYKVETVDPENNYVVVILSPKSQEYRNGEELEQRVRRIQAAVTQYYRITVTAAAGEVCQEAAELSKTYEHTLHLSNYRMLLGQSSYITSADIQENESHAELRYPAELEKKLIEQLKQGSESDVEEAVGDIFEAIAEVRYENMYHSILHFMTIIHQEMREMNHHRLQPLRMDIKAFYQEVLSQETLYDIRMLFLRELLHIKEQLKGSEEMKYTVLFDTIKSIIEEQYTDPDLNVQSIASRLKMSTTTISKVFKQRESLAITEYINKLRLEAAVELLEKEERSTKEIIVRVGFGNESYFYKVFKKAYGVTPKEYQLKRLSQL